MRFGDLDVPKSITRSKTRLDIDLVPLPDNLDLSPTDELFNKKADWKIAH